MDVQRADVRVEALAEYSSSQAKKPLAYLNGFSLDALRSLIMRSKRPILLLGSGVKLANAQDGAAKFARKYGLPVVTSLLGKGAFPEGERLSLGMIGSYGIRCANLALANADLVIAIGSRIDTRQTGTNLDSFVREGRIVRVDIDEAELKNHRLRNVDSVLGDAKAFVELLDQMPWGSIRDSWLIYTDSLKQKYGQDAEIARNVDNKSPYQVMDVLNKMAAHDQIFIVDIGQNQMFAAQKLLIRDEQAWRTSGGLAAMGFAVPTAIGAAFATSLQRPIYAITGDGGLHMSLQSLLTISQYNLPIKIVLINNGSLGMITQFQDLYFDSRKEGTTKDSGYLVPNFKLISEACGLTYRFISSEDLNSKMTLEEALRAEGPALIECDVKENTVVYPKLEVNMPIEDLNPKLDRCELHRTMIINDWPSDF